MEARIEEREGRKYQTWKIRQKIWRKNSFDILVLLKGAGTKNVVINRSIISHFILVSLKKSCNVLIIESNSQLICLFVRLHSQGSNDALLPRDFQGNMNY